MDLCVKADLRSWNTSGRSCAALPSDLVTRFDHYTMVLGYLTDLQCEQKVYYQ